MDRNFEHIFELILLRNIQEKFKLNFPLAEKQKMMVQCKFKKLSVDEKKILESFIESKNKDILEYIKFNLEFKPKLTIDPELNDSQKNTLQHFYNQKISNNIQITKLELSDLSVKMKIDKKIIKKYLLSIFNNGNKKLITIKTSSTIEKSAAGVSAAAQPRQPGRWMGEASPLLHCRRSPESRASKRKIGVAPRKQPGDLGVQRRDILGYFQGANLICRRVSWTTRGCF